MVRHALAAATLLALPLAVPVHAVEITHVAQGPVIEFAVSESVEVTPDIARISAGVTTEALSATDAARQNATAMRAVVDALREIGIAERDIQTSRITLSPRYDYEQTSRRQEFRGYQASNRVSVRLREIERVSSVLDALIEAGATDLSGPDWSIQDPVPHQIQARAQAMRSAAERAREMAALAGYNNARLLQVSEGLAFDRPVPMAPMRMMETASDTAPPVVPGEVETGVTLQLTYELVN